MADLVIRNHKGIYGGGIPLLFKCEWEDDFSPMDPLVIHGHQISSEWNRPVNHDKNWLCSVGRLV